MLNVTDKNELLEQFTEAVNRNVKTNVSGMDLVGFCKSGDLNVVKCAVEKIRANITSAFPEGYGIPKTALYVNGSGSGKDITLLSITLSSCWKDAKEFKFSIQVPVSDAIVSTVADFFKASYEQLFVDMLIESNLEIMNAMIADFVKTAGVSYSVKLVSPLSQQGKKIAYISDDEVQFVVDPEKVFDIDDILIFQEPGEFISEEAIENAKEPIINELGLCQTTVKLVGVHGGVLIKYMCNIGTQVKAMTLLRKVNSKNAERLTGKNDSAAYFERDDVYSIVARKDGHFEVVLKPFNVKTLETVDYDVLGALAG